jgi:hypothetical protein
MNTLNETIEKCNEPNKTIEKITIFLMIRPLDYIKITRTDDQKDAVYTLSTPVWFN